MNIEDFKNDILQHTVKPGIVIFENSDNSFVANQYIKEISSQRHMSIEQIENITEVSGRSNDIFGMTTLDSVLHVCRMKEFNSATCDIGLIERNDVVIVCDKAIVGPAWEERVVKIPRLEEWQIKDYIYSKVEGVDRKQLDWLQELCGNDIYRIDEEVSKIVLFDKKEQSKMFSRFIEDNVFSDLSTFNIFNMSNAILNKDIVTLRRVWAEIDRIDVEPLGLVTILKNSIRNIIKIQLSSCPTAENTGMSPKQFYAVSKSCGRFTKSRLLEIFTMLTDVDKRLKNGTLPADLILDYIVLNILK